MNKTFDIVKPDWVSFTVSNTYSRKKFLKELILEGSPVLYKQYGRFGYNRSAQFVNGGMVYWSTERADMGYHVVVPSRAIQFFGFLWWVSRISVYGGRVRRFDLCVDTDSLKMDVLLEKFIAGDVTTRFRQNSLIVGDVNDPCRTWYFGSRTSDSFARIYEKGKQMKSDEDYLRIEFEFKKDRADMLYNLYIEGQDVIEFLLGYLAFREDDSSRATRASIWEDWAKIFGRVRNWLRIKDRSDVTLERQIEWLKRQVSKVLVSVIDKAPDAFEEICDIGYQKQSCG